MGRSITQSVVVVYSGWPFRFMGFRNASIGSIMICIIPARGGSRRIKHKNRKLFHGKPIIAYSIETAKESELFNEIYVSTDDMSIGIIAHQYDARCYARMPHLANDDIGTQEVAQDLLLALGRDDEYTCVLYATSPLLEAEDLKKAFKMMEYGFPYVYSVDKHGRDAGCFYFGKTQAFIDRVPLDRSVKYELSYACDINTHEDWRKAEQMYLRRYGETKRTVAV